MKHLEPKFGAMPSEDNYKEILKKTLDDASDQEFRNRRAEELIDSIKALKDKPDIEKEDESLINKHIDELDRIFSERKPGDFRKEADAAIDELLKEVDTHTFLETLKTQNGGDIYTVSKAIEMISGSDSAEAWRIRYEALQKHGAMESQGDDKVLHGILTGLFGLFSKRAEAMRKKIFESPSQFAPGDANGLLNSYCGASSEEDLLEKIKQYGLGKQDLEESPPYLIASFDWDISWSIRKKLLIKAVDQRGGGASNRLLISLGGIDTERAWKIREKVLYEGRLGGNLAATSIMGIDSPKAWELRKRFLEISGDLPTSADENLLISLTGLDTPRAWRIREIVFEKYRDLQSEDSGSIMHYLAMSLVGLGSANAWRMRDEFAKSEKLKEYLRPSLYGGPSTAWLLRKMEATK